MHNQSQNSYTIVDLTKKSMFFQESNPDSLLPSERRSIFGETLQMLQQDHNKPPGLRHGWLIMMTDTESV